MFNKDGKVIAWWSAGVTSAVACKLAIDCYGKDNVLPIYFKIDSAHKDNDRFKKECEEWYGLEIIERRSEKYKDHFEVIEKTKYINGPAGARCTGELKKNVRFMVEKDISYSNQVFGFEYDKKEINRAVRFMEQYPDSHPVFPLIEHRMSKKECLFYLERNGIKRPVMYSLGYSNNNCIGCVKGGGGYWNKIKKDFPEHFEKMSALEVEIGATCLKRNGEKLYLKDLPADYGNQSDLIIPDCGSFCEIEFSDIEHKKLGELFDQPSDIINFYQHEHDRQISLFK